MVHVQVSYGTLNAGYSVVMQRPGWGLPWYTKSTPYTPFFCINGNESIHVMFYSLLSVGPMLGHFNVLRIFSTEICLPLTNFF